MDIRSYMEKHSLTQEEFGRLVDVTQAMVSLWLSGEPVSPERARVIEKKTRGAISRMDLRPDVFA
jgi:DNA-binding transcriptional regulator YdaS (Cro superfamily)